MELAYQRQGKGQPFVILHGLFGSLDNWRSHALSLAQHYDVLTLDLRNHGRSPHSSSHRVDDMATDVQAFLAAHHVQRPILMGHSMGGKVAMLLAQRQPQSIDRLIVVDIAPKAYPRGHDDVFEALQSLDLSGLTHRSQAEDHMRRHGLDEPTAQFLLKGLARTEAGFQWKFNLPVLHRDYPHQLAALPQLPATNLPCLFVLGERSRYVLPGDWPDIEQRFPLATRVIIPQAGHWVHAEQPQAFMRALGQWLGVPLGGGA